MNRSLNEDILYQPWPIKLVHCWWNQMNLFCGKILFICKRTKSSNIFPKVTKNSDFHIKWKIEWLSKIKDTSGSGLTNTWQFVGSTNRSKVFWFSVVPKLFTVDKTKDLILQPFSYCAFPPSPAFGPNLNVQLRHTKVRTSIV